MEVISSSSYSEVAAIYVINRTTELCAQFGHGLGYDDLYEDMNDYELLQNGSVV